MQGYFSIKEAAKRWGISERRVQFLCKEERIPGAIKFGRWWAIPDGAEKPKDERIGRAGGKYAARPQLTAAQMYGERARTMQNKYYSPERINDGAHDCIFTQYDIFPGISMTFHDIFVERLNYDADATSFPPGLISIQHCRQGRFEGEYSNGEFVYLGDGDLVMNRPEISPAGSYPLSSYHGLQIVIECETAVKTLSRLETVFGTLSIDIQQIYERLDAGNQMVLFRKDPMVEHILSEIYTLKSGMQESYLKLKTLELLIYLSAADFTPTLEQPYYLRSQVLTVKKIRDYLIKHLEQHFTLEHLSHEFQIPLTAMKNCFKGVYGMPVQAYIREYRMQAAADLLIETDLSVAEIGLQVGYESPSKFTAGFRKIMGCTPRDYRTSFRLNGTLHDG